MTVQDVNGCTTTEQINIDQSIEELSASIEDVQEANCGETDGSFRVATNNGSAPFTYDIGNGETDNPLFENLAFGEYEVTVTDMNGCTVSETATVESITGVFDKNDFPITLFPNPVNNTINIVSEANSNYAYVIYDSIGQEIISGNGSMINVEILNSGVYYIRINNSITKSFIKI